MSSSIIALAKTDTSCQASASGADQLPKAVLRPYPRNADMWVDLPNDAIVGEAGRSFCMRTENLRRHTAADVIQRPGPSGIDRRPRFACGGLVSRETALETGHASSWLGGVTYQSPQPLLLPVLPSRWTNRMAPPPGVSTEPQLSNPWSTTREESWRPATIRNELWRQRAGQESRVLPNERIEAYRA